MNHISWVSLRAVLLTGSMFLLMGCGSQADENKPIDEVRSEAQQMDVGQLKSKAMAYKQAIEVKLAEVGKIKDQLKGISPMELLGEEAKSLKTEIDTVSQSVKALKDRFQIYYNKLKEMEGDLSGLEL